MAPDTYFLRKLLGLLASQSSDKALGLTAGVTQSLSINCRMTSLARLGGGGYRIAVEAGGFVSATGSSQAAFCHCDGHVAALLAKNSNSPHIAL